MKINQIITEGPLSQRVARGARQIANNLTQQKPAVWKNARNPNASAATSPQKAAPKQAAPANTGPGMLKKGLFKATGMGSKDTEQAVKKDNYIKTVAAEFDNLARGNSGAYNPTAYAQKYIQQNNWGPLNPQQQQALNSALRSQDSSKIGEVMYQIGMQNRGGGAAAKPAGAAAGTGKPMPANADPNSKNTLGTKDQLSPAAEKIISQIGMMAVPSAIDDLEAILRAALNSLNRVAPGEYAEMVKMVSTGQKPKPNVPQDDNPNIVKGENE